MSSLPRSGVACTVLVLLLIGCKHGDAPAPLPPPPLPAAAALREANADADSPVAAKPLLDGLRADLGVHRQLALLTEDERTLKGAARDARMAQGLELYHQRTALSFQLNAALARLAQRPAEEREGVVSALLDWMEKSPEVQPLDRLSFRDSLRVLQHELAGDRGSESAQLQRRIARNLRSIDQTEKEVDAEYRASGDATSRRGRALWDAYIRKLRALYPTSTAAPPAPPAPAPSVPDEHELTGRELPAKTVVLSFDDGPHPTYTEEIRALLVQNELPAVFFEVGRNVGRLDITGAPVFGPLARHTRDLVRDGFVIGNHSYTHAHLNLETGAPLELEISETDTLLQATPGAHSSLFRFPYGARTQVQLNAIEAHHLRSVLWNIDSLDWADPVPSSVLDRVLRELAREQRGIVLFHDIHDRAGKVVPTLIERLKPLGYRFVGLTSAGELTGS